MVRTNAADALPIQLARVDWADYLPGDDEALHVRQVIAQDVFGEELWADERVRAFFAPWFAEFDRIQSTIDAHTENAPGEAFGKLYREMAEPLADLCARELVVPPWTSIDLLRRFVAESSSRITGENVWLRAAIEYVKPAATADYEATFKIRKGMTEDEERRALAEFNARVMLETGMGADDESK